MRPDLRCRLGSLLLFALFHLFVFFVLWFPLVRHECALPCSRSYVAGEMVCVGDRNTAFPEEAASTLSMQFGLQRVCVVLPLCAM